MGDLLMVRTYGAFFHRRSVFRDANHRVKRIGLFLIDSVRALD